MTVAVVDDEGKLFPGETVFVQLVIGEEGNAMVTEVFRVVISIKIDGVF